MTVAGIELREIDAKAIAGGYQLVFGEGQFAIVRFLAMRWRFSSGQPLDFFPTHYHVAEAA